MANRFLGNDTVTHNTGISSGAIILEKFTAVESGTMTEFHIFGQTGGNVKVAIYSDSGGTPNALLNTVGSTAINAGAANTITFPSTIITAGTVYWLAYNFDTNSGVAVNGSGGTTLADETALFTDPFPSTYPGGYTSQTWNIAFASYGNLSGGHPVLII